MKQSMKKIQTACVCLTAAGLLLSFAGCGGTQAQPTAASSEQSTAIAVKTQKPQTGDLTQATEYMGKVEPDRLVEVSGKMSGTVKNVYVGVGDEVHKGDVLMTFDTTDLAVTLSAQKAQIEVARAAVMTAQAQVDQSLGSTFDLQLANLESGVQQAKNAYASARQGLRDYNESSGTPADQIQAQRDKARENVALLETALQGATDNLKQIRSDLHLDDPVPPTLSSADKLLLANAEENVASHKQNLKQAEDQLSLLNSNYNDDDTDVQLRSLRTGVRNAQLAYDSANTIYELTNKDVRNDALKVANASLGQAAASFDAAVKGYEAQAHQLTFAEVTSPIDGVVEACNVIEDAMPDTKNPLFIVSNKSKLVTTFYVSEDAALQLALGDKIKIESGRNTYNGTISEIGTMVDATGLFKVKATVDDGELMSGVAVKITANTGKAEGLLIPQSAIYYENGQAYVYCSKDGKAVRTDITLGLSNNELSEVITGLDSTSEIIVTWNPNLRDGVEISVLAGDTGSSASGSSEASPASSATSSADTSSAASASDASSVASDASSTSSGVSSQTEESAGEAAE